MNFEVFNPAKVGQQDHTQLPKVLLYQKSGTFEFTAQAVRALNIEPGTSLVFLQDKDRQKDWYIQRAENGFKLKVYSNLRRARFSSTQLQKKILDSLKIQQEKGSVKFLIAQEPITTSDGHLAYAILTSRPL